MTTTGDSHVPKYGEALRNLSDFIERLSAGTPLPGGSIAVVDRNGILAEHCFGLADIGSEIRVTRDHRFEIGSISKIFVSLLVNQLADEGLLNLDAPITDILPWLDLGLSSNEGAPITARHLLSHTSGLVMGADSVPDEMAQVWALRDLVRTSPPGQRFHYSNVGFMVLGCAVAEITGLSLAELMARRLFGPMGIPSALAEVTHLARKSMATGYWPLHDDQPCAPGDPISPATWFEVAAADGNIAANIVELAQLVRLLLGAGELDGKQIVSSSAMERIAKPHAPTGEDILVWGASPGAEDSRYGLGVNVERINGHECLTHGGGMVGYASFVLADRTSGIGVAVLTNINGDIPAAQLIARIAHDLFLAVVEERALPDLPDPAGGLRSAEMPDAMFGSFEALVTYGTPVHLEIEAGPDGLLCVIADGEHGRVYRTWSKRFVTDHPGLRTHHLQFDGLHWIHGPFMFSPKGAQETQPKLDDRLLAYVGHYRGYSPWYTNFRIVARNGRLYLLAPGGVEAPSEDVELVELTEGTFRLGADPWLPERLLAGPLVNGRAISMARDGAIYSRAFTK